MLTVTSLATLDGRLAIDLTGGFKLATGDSFGILGFAALTGDFASLALGGAARSSTVTDMWTCAERSPFKPGRWSFTVSSILPTSLSKELTRFRRSTFGRAARERLASRSRRWTLGLSPTVSADPSAGTNTNGC